jgi:hypothetical protein
MEPKQSVTPSIENDAKEAACGYIARGWSVVPVPRGEKGCKLPDWQGLRIKAGEVGEFFTEGSNVGVLLGEPSGGLADADLDCSEAVKIGPRFLPSTLRSGRGSGDSHSWYVSPDIASVKYKDVDGDVLAEIRSHGHQTVIHGTHPGGGRYAFSNPGTEPREIEAHELRSRVARVAAAALIARHLPAGGRHDLALAYAGLMLRNLVDRGMDGTEAHDWVYRVLEAAWQESDADSKALTDLTNIVQDTIEKIEADEPFTQENEIKELLPDHGAAIVKLLKKWFGWGDLTPAEREGVEQRQRVKRAEKAIADPKVQKIARSYDILDRFRGELRAAGIVGVDKQLKLLFAAGHSRFLDRPISVAVKGPSAGGKSKAVECAILNVQPDDAYIFFSGMSEKALIHSEADYRHKLLIVAEQAGVESEYQDYLFRTLLSESVIKYPVTEKVDGRFVVNEKVKEGPTGLITSTTRAKLHPENETRILSIHITDTRDHTKAIMRAQANDNRREMDTEPWKAYGTWLAGQDNRVSIPYSEALADLIPVYDVRQNRDITVLLNTIKTLAVMHQARRKRDAQGRIIATMQDYSMARDLLNDLLSQGIGATVSQSVRDTVAAVKALAPDGQTTNSKAVAAQLNVGKGAASNRISNALSEGYIVNLQEPGKRGHKLALGSPLPEDTLLLPEPHELLNAAACNIVQQFTSIWGCTKAAENLPSIVHQIVHSETRTKTTVSVFDKSYDLQRHTKSPYISDGEPDEGDENPEQVAGRLAPPNRANCRTMLQVPRICYKRRRLGGGRTN